MTNIWHSNIPERHPALFEYFQLLTFSKKKFTLLHPTTSILFFFHPANFKGVTYLGADGVTSDTWRQQATLYLQTPGLSEGDTRTKHV